MLPLFSSDHHLLLKKARMSFELSAARRLSAAASLDISAFVWRSWHGVHKVRKLEILAWPPAGSVRHYGRRVLLLPLHLPLPPVECDQPEQAVMKQCCSLASMPSPARNHPLWDRSTFCPSGLEADVPCS
jgi:hypothetical protein